MAQIKLEQTNHIARCLNIYCCLAQNKHIQPITAQSDAQMGQFSARNRLFAFGGVDSIVKVSSHRDILQAFDLADDFGSRW